jgi:shikimate dehydrogenase
MIAPKAFVVGWPVAHSRSPLIHGFWLKRYGIEGTYVAEAVPPDAIDAFLRCFAERGYVGGNVTLPHKEAAFRSAAESSEVARRLEAANTLWLEAGTLHADNTDVHGFAANLDERAPEWRKGKSALVIGAGGASRAVLLALIDAGFVRIALLNRTPARAEDLARHFGGSVEAGGLEGLGEALAQADLVVNATSAGLHDAAGLAVPWHAAKMSAIVTDLVYVPLVTPFLQGALQRGLKVVDGIGMLLHQAVPGFERWFGVRPIVDEELRALVVADLVR